MANDARIDIPPGLADLADVLISFLTAGKVKATVPPPSAAVVVRSRADTENRLIVDMTDLDERRLGGIAVAARLAALWIDPLSGDTGPVDDLGRPAWAAGQQRT